jgi:hypothetical protein
LLAEARAAIGPLGPAEREFLSAAASGNGAELRQQGAGSARSIRADCIRWLCTDPKASLRIAHHVGVVLAHVTIVGKLDLDDTSLEFPLECDTCTFPEGISMVRAHLRSLDLSGCQVGSLGPGDLAFDGSGLLVDHDVYLVDGFHSSNTFSLERASIGGDLDCEGGRFSGQEAAIDATALRVRGRVCFGKDFSASGGVILAGAEVGGGVETYACELTDSAGVALDLSRASIAGNVFLGSHCRVRGQLMCAGSTMAGDFICEHATLENQGGIALAAGRMTVGGEAKIDSARFRGAVDLSGTSIKRRLVWKNVAVEKLTKLNLEGAQIGVLDDDAGSWPPLVLLDGFIYDHLGMTAPRDRKLRRKWLGRESAGEFSPQPYEQLSRVYAAEGDRGEASELMVDMNDDGAYLHQMSLPRRLFHLTFERLIGYGYRPWNVLAAMAMFVLLGAFIFGRAEATGTLQPSTNDPLPRFDVVVYSLDTFAPLIDLDQRKHWRPTTRWTRLYWWVHTAVGWSLTTILAVGLGGLLRG